LNLYKQIQLPITPFILPPTKMKVFFATILALAAAATAAPTLEARACAPGTYSCATDAKGWQVCDVSGKWVVS